MDYNDKDTKKVQKYGEATRGEDKYGAGKQRRYSKKELDNSNSQYNKEVSGTKKGMHKWQTNRNIDYKKDNNGARPPLNKTDY